MGVAGDEPLAGRDEAEALLQSACRTALAERRPLVSVLQEKTGAALDWERLDDPSRYLGSADWLVERVLEEARRE